MNNYLDIILNIQRTARLKKYFITLFIFISIFGLLSFIFYSFYGANNAIKFISKKSEVGKAEKIMVNPKIKFEYEDGKIFNISASKAIHMDKGDVELFDVKASGNTGKISSGNLLITNNGNNLHFSNHPILIIKENNEQ